MLETKFDHAVFIPVIKPVMMFIVKILILVHAVVKNDPTAENTVDIALVKFCHAVTIAVTNEVTILIVVVFMLVHIETKNAPIADRAAEIPAIAPLQTDPRKEAIPVKISIVFDFI